jgi:hypothetical protein
MCFATRMVVLQMKISQTTGGLRSDDAAIGLVQVSENQTSRVQEYLHSAHLCTTLFTFL